MKISPKPYKLFNKIQHYDWGTRNDNAFIPHLLGIEPEPGLPYGELWIGAHPKAPSEILIEDKKYPLDKVIAEAPEDMLGSYTLKKFGSTLPFLLKVLSAERALSIQTHPNKEQAKRLHATDPKNYPDDNHKPEIAIAIDSLTAIAGFRPLKEIIINLIKHPELLAFTDNTNSSLLLYGKDDERIAAIKELYKNILLKTPEQLSGAISKIRERLLSSNNLTSEETQFLKQYDLFGDDAGLLSFFFFNIVELKSMQGIYTGAGVPHAYIKGNIVECMANSDNVVRAGLTNKFKDVNTLLEILHYEFAAYHVLNSAQLDDEVTYNTPAEEFIVKAYKKNNYTHTINTGSRPTVTLVISGKIEVSSKEYGAGSQESMHFSKGEAFITPALIKQYQIKSEGTAEYFIVEIGPSNLP